MADLVVPAIVFGMVCALLRFLHLTEKSEKPNLFFQDDSQFVQSVLDLCPVFREIFQPTWLWGKNGHLQTLFYVKLGWVLSPFPRGERCSYLMEDGATMTYDVFQPHKTHSTEGDYTILVCPGIANSSEASYVCMFVNHAQSRGYRVAVLNHLGVLTSVPLTSSRIFTYGGTDEYAAMVSEICKRYPSTKLVSIGFSMGGNIVLKYIGEDNSRQDKFLCVMSLCQGYNAGQAVQLAREWNHLRRLYGYVIAKNQKKIIKRHYDILLSKEVQEQYGIQPARVMAATAACEIDEVYNRRRAGFTSVEEYYKAQSCHTYLNKITLPVLLLNASNDPLVPPPLLEIGKEYAKTHKNALLVNPKHGGHLGFFQHGFVTPDPLSWLATAAVQYTEAIVTLYVSNKLPHRSLRVDCQQIHILYNNIQRKNTEIPAMDMEQNGNQNPVPLCRAGCGFYGNTAFEGMCSKCYKDAMKRKENAPTISGRLSPPTSTVTAVTAAGETDSVGNVTSTLAHTSLGTSSEPGSCSSLKDLAGSTTPSVETATPTVPIPGASKQELDKADSAIGGDPTEVASSPDDKKTKKNRCTTCKKKVGLTGFPCRCGGLFCSMHRYSDKHECDFNYKELAQEQIRKHNPVIVAEKIQKI
ncbi:abhydrolase domain-containing protein 2-like isoform X2 [Crassostrea virginica]